MLVRSRRLVHLSVLLAATVSACSHGRHVAPLKVLSLAVPNLGVPRYDAQGFWPQVSGKGLDLHLVNEALHASVTEDQRAYRPLASAEVRDEPTNEYRGLYELDFDPTLMVANTVLVSTMYPSLELYPGGNDGAGWISTTILVPSGQPITLARLFPSGSQWLVKVAALTRQEALKHEVCNPLDPQARPAFEEGLAAKPANYTNFALTTDGLDIGLGQGQIGAEACGARRITIPWKELRSALSVEGRRLATAAGQGLATAPCSLMRINKAFASRPAALRASRIDETAMAVQYADCVPGWALANVSPPDSLVTNSSGDEMVLFKAVGLGWREMAVVAATHGIYSGEDLSTCDLMSQGVPAADAARLVPVSPAADAAASC